MFIPVELEYDFSQVLDSDHRVNSDVCAYHQVQERLQIYEPFGGYPDSYNAHNTVIHQLWWSKDQIDYAAIGQQLGIEVVSIASIMQLPGHVIPYHRDLFHKINEVYPGRFEPRVRANIFLESGKLGHILQFTLGTEHHTVTNWQANTGYMFDNSILHLSCNAGAEPKYTLQISGLYLGQPQ